MPATTLFLSRRRVNLRDGHRSTPDGNASGIASIDAETNIDNFVRWMTFEEPASTWDRNNNPLNVMTNGSNAASSTYPTLNAAAAGTASVIGQTNMQSIYNALATSAPWPQFAQAVNASPWGTSVSVNPNPSLPPNITSTGKNLGGGGSAADTGKALAGTCGAGSQGVSLPLVGGHFFDACQTKALVGGLAVGLGGLIMLVGVVVIVRVGLSGTAAGRAAGTVAQAATKNPVAKAVVSSVSPRARQGRRDDRMYNQFVSSGREAESKEAARVNRNNKASLRRAGYAA